MKKNLLKKTLFLVAALCLTAVSASAYSVAYVETSSAGGGVVYCSATDVDIDAVTGWNASKVQIMLGNYNDMGLKTATPYWVYAKPNDGYVFKGWSRTNDAAGTIVSTEQKVEAIHEPCNSGDADQYQNWYAIFEAVPATADEITLTEDGKAQDGRYYASWYNSEKHLLVPAGARAETYRVANGKILVSKTYAAGEVVPAGQAVVISAETAGALTFNYTDALGYADNESMLLGSDDAKTDNEAGYSYYMLSTPPADSEFGVGFWWQVDGGASINNAAHKAYLKVPASAAAGAKGWEFGGTTTGISAIKNEELRIKNSFWYTLDGRMVAEPMQKGIYIHNGKKIVIK